VQTAIEELCGAPDEEVIRAALSNDKIIVTMDKDFGYLVQAYNTPGIVLLRLRIPTIQCRLEVILRALQLVEGLCSYMTVVTEASIRRRSIDYKPLAAEWWSCGVCSAEVRTDMKRFKSQSFFWSYVCR